MPSDRKKILYVITKSNWGGAQKYVFDLATNFKKEYDITVALGGEGELKQRLDLEQIKTVSIPYLERDINILKEIKVFFELIKIIKAEAPDIVHLNSSKIGVLGALACRIQNFCNSCLHRLNAKHFALRTARIIFTAHGWAFNEKRKPLTKEIIRIFHWGTVFLSNSVICVSIAMANEIKYPGFEKNKIHIIPNGLSKPVFYKKGEAQNFLIEKNQKLKDFFGFDLKKRKSTLWIGTISELHKNKGLNYMIEALFEIKKQYPSFVFLVIGEGEEREELQELIAKKHLEGHVILVGHIENAAKYLKSFNIFTLTSITEGLPYAVLEAGLAELPVVASNVGGIPEIIDQLQSGILVRPKEEKEIREAIEFILEHRDKRKLFTANLKTKVKEQFSVEKMIEETRKVYKEKG